jgi:hypothetical protein
MMPPVSTFLTGPPLRLPIKEVSTRTTATASGERIAA